MQAQRHGHSLGGIYAREIARVEPAVIHQVITLGSHIGLNVNAVVWFWIAKKLAEVDSRIGSAAC